MSDDFHQFSDDENDFWKKNSRKIESYLMSNLQFAKFHQWNLFSFVNDESFLQKNDFRRKRVFSVELKRKLIDIFIIYISETSTKSVSLNVFVFYVVACHW